MTLPDEAERILQEIVGKMFRMAPLGLDDHEWCMTGLREAWRAGADVRQRVDVALAEHVAKSTEHPASVVRMYRVGFEDGAMRAAEIISKTATV